METIYTINIFAKRFLGRAFVESMKFHDEDYLQKALDKAEEMGLAHRINDIHAFQKFDLSTEGVGFKPEYVEYITIVKEGRVVYKIDIAKISLKEMKRGEFRHIKDAIDYKNWQAKNIDFDQAVSEVMKIVNKYPKLFTVNKI